MTGGGGAVWSSQGAGNHQGSRFVLLGGGNNKQSPGIVNPACAALSSAPRLPRKGFCTSG